MVDLNVEQTPRNRQLLPPQQRQLLQHPQQQLRLQRQLQHRQSLSMFLRMPGLLHHGLTIFQQASGLNLSELQQRQQQHLQQQQLLQLLQLPQPPPLLPRQQRHDQRRCRCG